MADNTQLNSGTGGDVIATDDLTTLNGGAVSAVKAQRVKVGFGVDGTFRDVEAANGLPVVTYSGAIAIGARPDGFLRAQIDPTTLLFDTFETLDTANTWTLGGTAPTGTAGVLTINASTTASATSYAVSKPAFTPGSSAYLQFASLCTVQTGTVTGVNQFFGLGTVTTPTVSVPVQNGSIFEIDTTGALLGSVYSAGTRTQTVSLTKPIDGAVHRYAIYYKASRVYFEIDNVQVGTLPFPNPSVSALNSLIGQANSASITGTPTLTSSLIGVGDTGRNATKLSDGTYPWRQVQIGVSGGLSVKGASIAGVNTSIAAAATGTVGPLAIGEAGNASYIVKNTVAASPYAGNPVLVFEQSDDNVSWAALLVTRADTGITASTFTLAPNTANGEVIFNAALYGVNWTRVRVTTGPATNAMSIVIAPGGLPFTPSVSILTLPALTTGNATIGAVKLTDGTNTAVVKAASTASVAADTSVVVALSPNSPITLSTPTAFTLSSAATTNATSVKASAGTVFQITASNVGAAAAFLKVFNLATAPTVGTSVPLMTIPIAASGVVTIPFGTLGMRFGTGIALSITNLVADADATAVAAAQVKVAIAYI